MISFKKYKILYLISKIIIVSKIYGFYLIKKKFPNLKIIKIYAVIDVIE